MQLPKQLKYENILTVGEVKPSVPCRRFTACKRTLRALIEMFRKLNFSPKSPDCVPDGSGGHIRIDRTAASHQLPQMRTT
jgi:hypothetical protein